MMRNCLIIGMIKMKRFLVIAALAAICLPTVARADSISLGQPGYGGTGCPAGTASTVLSPDRKSLSILFDNCYVEAGGSTNRSLSRKACSLAIPVHIPQGLSISILAIDYRGYNSIPAGATSQFNVECPPSAPVAQI